MKLKKFLSKKNMVIIAILLILIVLIAVSVIVLNNKNVDLLIPKNEDETEEVEEQKEVQIIDLNSDSRPIAVMINNIAVARKYHSGLQDAYLVYEMIVEGGLTRLMALYKDADTARIGSIRSSRHYYLDYALENDAIYVHWGYSQYAQRDIPALGINNVNGLIYGSKYFWRDKSLNVSSEHTAFSSMELIKKGISDLGYRTTTTEKPLLNYDADPIDLSSMDGAIPATNVSIKYSSSVTTEYTYDSETETYKRSVNGTAHTDYVTKEQYTAKNIITYKVANSTISGDSKGCQELDNIGSGDGYYISNGYAIPIKWEKKSRSSKTIYTLTNGEELVVNDGNTYIQIQPDGQKLTIE
jgi:cell division protein FtsL